MAGCWVVNEELCCANAHFQKSTETFFLFVYFDFGSLFGDGFEKFSDNLFGCLANSTKAKMVIPVKILE